MSAAVFTSSGRQRGWRENASTSSQGAAIDRSASIVLSTAAVPSFVVIAVLLRSPRNAMRAARGTAPIRRSVFQQTKKEFT
jgi:hypothetical protein